MAYQNILSKLQIECPFPDAFSEPANCSEHSAYLDTGNQKIGHIRADYDGHRWWATAFPSYSELQSKHTAKEMDMAYAALTAKDAFCDLQALRRFCEDHMEACIDREFQQEFNFYLSGESCNFWIRLITRNKDYNLYLNAYTKPVQKYFECLDKLRASGQTNMYGAEPYLREAFPELRNDPERARLILLAWIQSFFQAEVQK